MGGPTARPVGVVESHRQGVDVVRVPVVRGQRVDVDGAAHFLPLLDQLPLIVVVVVNPVAQAAARVDRPHDPPPQAVVNQPI